MEHEILMVKNMVCNRCLRIVEDELNAIGVRVESISLGRVSVMFDTAQVTRDHIDGLLRTNGFELLEDEEHILVEKIKVYLRSQIDTMRTGADRPTLSSGLSTALCTNYGRLSRTFSRLQGVTIERYFIHLKIERVKELIHYGELSFKEIAYDLGYASLQHLSGQFKQTTGMSMSQYKRIAGSDRMARDKIL